MKTITCETGFRLGASLSSLIFNLIIGQITKKNVIQIICYVNEVITVVEDTADDFNGKTQF